MDLIALKAILNAWCSAHSTSHLPGQESPSRRTERTRGFDLGESPSSTGKDSGRAGLGAHWPSPQDLEGLSPQEAVKALVACAVRPAAAMGEPLTCSCLQHALVACAVTTS